MKITIFTDGAAKGNPGPAAIGVTIIDGKEKVVLEVSEIIGNATDDYAEYFAVVRGLQVCLEKFCDKTKAIKFELKTSSELVGQQLNNQLPIKNPGLVPLFIEIHNMRVINFLNLRIIKVTEAENKKAQSLAIGALVGK